MTGFIRYQPVVTGTGWCGWDIHILRCEAETASTVTTVGKRVLSKNGRPDFTLRICNTWDEAKQAIVAHLEQKLAEAASKTEIIRNNLKAAKQLTKETK